MASEDNPNPQNEASINPGHEKTPPKRGHGHLRGSKNKPGCGNVGRPRRDGQPPKSRFTGAPQVAPPKSNQLAIADGTKPNTNTQNASAQPATHTSMVNAKQTTQGTLPKSTVPAGATTITTPIATTQIATTPAAATPAVLPDFNFGSIAIAASLSPTVGPSRSPSSARANVLTYIEPDIGEPEALGLLLSSNTFGTQPVMDDDNIEYCTPSPPLEPQPRPPSSRMGSCGGSVDAGDMMDWEDGGLVDGMVDGLESGNRRLEGWGQSSMEKVDWRLEGRGMVDMGVQVWEESEIEGDRSGQVDPFGVPEDDLCSISGSDIEEIFPGITDLPVEDTQAPLMESESDDTFSIESDSLDQGLDEVLGRSSVGLNKELNADLTDPQPVLPVWIDGAAAMVRRQLRQEIKNHRYPLSYLRGSLSIDPPNPLFVVGQVIQPSPHAFYKTQFDAATAITGILQSCCSRRGLLPVSAAL
ncbi:hypothetical protein M407DRAFT_32331 [Tulasnella calospora MUT 4182]|uniref:Uncharacterized protein n=1 Tax=Tulasnella calospora MUT 4182 TaxID=1051891 RepID=A0A0C3Q4Y9_9AGAM|nr:hypothetical protein M407DRAFT_32331 [Tulasnella calospora MUT 4182]